ncbi:hypothetical protein [Nocardioides iriomotensis]|uniref:Uncharacterized protein n=1 Tax=Nocardioides iriomotensis TaxID=715784 RepID=A0A4Q5IXW2_9ACTN|nr:hypothetical protein [Nocardioides iriomotensis]RYU10962.1 hypothetical protein ETU37_14720 [Nocardioides iriomotensis]
MGLGAGALLLAVGAILNYAVDVDVPYVNDDALGSILMAAGVVLLAVGLALHAARSSGGMTDTGAGLLMFAVGAVLAFALDVDVPYIWDWALGLILMVGGAIAIVASLVMHRQQTQTRRVVHDRL